MDSQIRRGLEDRISELPDAVLCHILSFMPTKYAVLTSVLSKRWQYLWTGVNTLDFDNSLLFHEPDDGSSAELELLRFTEFVNMVLSLSDVLCLKRFCLRLESFCVLELVDSWICAVTKGNVQKVELHYGEYYKWFPVVLPRAIFTSKTLVDLTLDGPILLVVDASVWLPSLKILNLVDLLYENNDSLQKLFSKCPILEELCISRCRSGTGGELNVSVPTLRRLTITRFGDGIHDHLTKLVVNAPKLEHIHLSDYVTQEFLLENLSSLLRACLVIGGDRLTIYDGCISMLLMGIANVKSLDYFSELSDYRLPTFPNLTHLRLGGRNGGWNLNLLNEFLNCSPNLQVLTLEENRVPGSTKCWTPPTRVPCCLLSHLEEIRILKFDGDGYDLGVIVYLLESAQVLKKLTIDCQNSTRFFRDKLAEFPRGSRTCQLSFLV
ncbi:hypothetical protein RHMOL_Rhmol06G0294000 [Rhododendron molle]|uniref:Uncharacterized protein n=1 Tax=Rhododendron molle TaxID=49168 RepID=A0ACC0NHM9_RHOML|nr:hypothetical protein RHMOL_Rhmol06G0294000 [Rhododendron molle]